MDDYYSAWQLISNSSSTSTAQGVMIWTIVAGVLAIVGSILVYFLFIKSKADFKGFAKVLKDYLSCDTIHIEALAKMFYYAGLIYVVLTSINSLVLLGGNGILSFFEQLLLGPIVVRFGFEIIMMFIRIWKNTEHGKK